MFLCFVGRFSGAQNLLGAQQDVFWGLCTVDAWYSLWRWPRPMTPAAFSHLVRLRDRCASGCVLLALLALATPASARDRVAETLLFRDDSTRVPGNPVFYFDNRAEEHIYEKTASQVLDTLLRGDPEKICKTIALAGDRAEASQVDELTGLLQFGLTHRTFRDTAMLARWLGEVNHYANFKTVGLEPYTLVVVNSESHLSEARARIRESGRPIAGAVFGGSPKMLSEPEVHQQPVIVETIDYLRQDLLRQQTPVLGICFGGHLLGKAAFDVFPEWMTVPEDPPGIGYELLQNLGTNGEVMAATPGEKLMVYGSRKIKRLQRHPLLDHVDGVPGLMVHSQYFFPGQPGIPTEAILAVSRRLFLRHPEHRKARRMTVMSIVQAMRAGRFAYGTQLHPELTPELLYFLTFVPQIAAALKAEGQDLDLIRAGLVAHPRARIVRDGEVVYRYGGQRVGYNWCKRILAPHTVTTRLSDPTAAQLVLDRLLLRDPELSAPMSSVEAAQTLDYPGVLLLPKSTPGKLAALVQLDTLAAEAIALQQEVSRGRLVAWPDGHVSLDGRVREASILVRVDSKALRLLDGLPTAELYAQAFEAVKAVNQSPWPLGFETVERPELSVVLEPLSRMNKAKRDQVHTQLVVHAYEKFGGIARDWKTTHAAQGQPLRHRGAPLVVRFSRAKRNPENLSRLFSTSRAEVQRLVYLGRQ